MEKQNSRWRLQEFYGGWDYFILLHPWRMGIYITCFKQQTNIGRNKDLIRNQSGYNEISAMNNS